MRMDRPARARCIVPRPPSAPKRRGYPRPMVHPAIARWYTSSSRPTIRFQS